MPQRRHFVWLICLAWATLIYLTSSTVVMPHELFDWMHAHVFRSDSAIQRFEVFWGASWLFVVKGWHVFEFAVLMLLATSSLDKLRNRQSPSNILLAALACTIYAVLDEWHQTFIPGRGGVVSDVLIDVVGIALAGSCRALTRSAPAKSSPAC